MVMPTHRPLTYDDLAALPEPTDGKRHEIIDGEHYVTASPFTKHQRVAVNLTLALGNFVEDHESGELLIAPTDVVFSSINVVVPDLLYIARERLEIVTEKNIQGAPDLVVEILSPSTRKRDLGIKRALYERVGVREYWLVDPAPETIQVYRLDAAGFQPTTILSAAAGDVLTTPLLPGFEVRLAKLFS